MPIAFCDTNVLIYAYAETADSRKQSVARNLVDNLVQSGNGCLSAQVLSEFFWVSTVKMRPSLSTDTAKEHIRQLCRMRVVALDEHLVQAAIERSRMSQISYWDALIVEAATTGAATILYSEDMQHGMRFGDLQVINPFVES